MYVASCKDGTLYVGIARDVAARIAAHDAGKGAKYTRGRGPLRVLATRRCKTKGDALRLELALKRLSRSEKAAVAASRAKLATVARRTRAARKPSASGLGATSRAAAAADHARDHEGPREPSEGAGRVRRS